DAGNGVGDVELADGLLLDGVHRQVGLRDDADDAVLRVQHRYPPHLGALHHSHDRGDVIASPDRAHVSRHVLVHRTVVRLVARSHAADRHVPVRDHAEQPPVRVALDDGHHADLVFAELAGDVADRGAPLHDDRVRGHQLGCLHLAHRSLLPGQAVAWLMPGEPAGTASGTGLARTAPTRYISVTAPSRWWRRRPPQPSPGETMALTIRSTIRLNNGVEIPRLGLGVYRAAAGSETRNAVLWALEAGYRHVDTAAIYGNEADVGRAIRESGIPREEVFVTTKLWNDDHGYDEALAAFDASLKRLGFDHVDLYLIHWPVSERRLESWRALERL